MTIATHRPAPNSDFLVFIDLADHGMPGRKEQIWVEQVESNQFIVRSLPFFAYGIRPGDRVKTTDSLVVESVVAASGERLLRVAAASHVSKAITAELHLILEELELIHEWHREGYVAIALASEHPPEMLRSFLVQRADSGEIQWELA